jgi:hypothetical protein
MLVISRFQLLLVYSLGPSPLLLLEASLELPFHDAVQHHLRFCVNICDPCIFFSLTGFSSLGTEIIPKGCELVVGDLVLKD